jgi:hypothetical protein
MLNKFNFLYFLVNMATTYFDLLYLWANSHKALDQGIFRLSHRRTSRKLTFLINTYIFFC